MAAEFAENGTGIEARAALRRLEAWGLGGAKILFAAHQPLIDRFRALAGGVPPDLTEFVIARLAEHATREPAHV